MAELVFQASSQGRRWGESQERGNEGEASWRSWAAPGRLRVLKATSRRWQRRAQALDTHLLVVEDKLNFA
jgi:hypothetical protein